MIKLIATDMDGTMLKEDKTYDASFFDDYKIMKEKGIYFVVASGNQYELLKSKFPLALQDELIYIAENGAKIVKDKQVIYKDTLSKKDRDQILQILNEFDHCMTVYCGVEHAYVLNKFKDKEAHLSNYYRNYQYVDSFDHIDEDCLKFSISCWDDIEKDTKLIASRLPKQVRLVTTGHVWFDIFNQDTNKGHALLYVMDLLHLSKEECAAFGDQLNDLEMLQSVHYGYAMENGCKEVKEIAYQVIGTNEESAMLKKLHELVK